MPGLRPGARPRRPGVAVPPDDYRLAAVSRRWRSSAPWYAVERDVTELKLGDAALSVYRRERAGPFLARFADWLAEQHRVALPKSGFGQVVS